MTQGWVYMPSEGVYYSLPKENFSSLKRDHSLSKGDITLEKGLRSQSSQLPQLLNKSFDGAIRFLLACIM